MHSQGEKAYRYRGENVLTLKMVTVPRRTKDYVAPDVDPQIQEALDDALNDEHDTAPITIDTTQVHTAHGTRSKNAQGAHSSTSTATQQRRTTTTASPARVYPKSRGLVK